MTEYHVIVETMEEFPTEDDVKGYMWQQVKSHVDPLLPGEVNSIMLAEDACNFFDAYRLPPEYDIPEEFLDWALQVATEEEEKRCV